MPNFLENLFGKKKDHNEAVNYEGPLRDGTQENTTLRARVQSYPLQYRVGCGQSVGLQRDHNEDTLFTYTSLIADGQGEQLFGLFIIADGMGGHQNGEVASSISVRIVSKYIIDHIFSNMLIKSDISSDEGIQDALINAIQNAQEAVINKAPGGGTTITIALLLGKQVTLAHVGDSRAYFVFPDGGLQKLTRDHSFVQHLIDLNEITEEEAATHPQKNVILKAIGQAEEFTPDIKTITAIEGARLLICSDGLWGVVPDDRMVELLIGESDPNLACRKLVDAANEEGGPDNISVIVVEIPYGI